MEQTTMRLRRGGWSQKEANMLWETADEATQQGLPLKSVFEHVAQKTGRRPNSIRNYYYAQVQKQLGEDSRPSRFIPFTDDEVTKLLTGVLMASANGQSVRSCLKKMSDGDHSLMLRYQNKYRSVVKTRPELVASIVKQLNEDGVEASVPCVSKRNRACVSDVCERLNDSARQNEDPELIKACETLSAFIARASDALPNSRNDLDAKLDTYRTRLNDNQTKMLAISDTANNLISVIKQFLGQASEKKIESLDEFCSRISEKIGVFEQNLRCLETEPE